MPERRPLQPADLRRQVVVEELDLSPDGTIAIVARRTTRRDKYVAHLLAIPLDRATIARPRALTEGMVRDGWPRVSPDGRTVAFIRSDPTDDDAPAALMTMPSGGGSPRRYRGRGHGGVSELAWSPDGSRIAFTASVDPPRFIVGPSEPVDKDVRTRRRRGDDPASKSSDVPTPAPGTSVVSTGAGMRPGTSTTGRTCSCWTSRPGDPARSPAATGGEPPDVASGRTDGGVHHGPWPRGGPEAADDHLGGGRGRADARAT